MNKKQKIDFLTKFSLNYLHSKYVFSKVLNLDNFDKMTKSKIKSISKNFDEEYWNIYVRDLFKKWINKNIKYTDSFIKVFKRLGNKFSLTNDTTYKNLLKILEKREFTQRRNFKTIEVPYKDQISSSMSKFALFAYKNIKLYEDGKWIKLIFKGELYITPTEIIFFHRPKNLIFEVINVYQIKEIRKKPFSVKIFLDNARVIHINYLDIEIIYISLKRVMNKRNIIFTDLESNSGIDISLEKTEEMILIPSKEKKTQK